MRPYLVVALVMLTACSSSSRGTTTRSATAVSTTTTTSAQSRRITETMGTMPQSQEPSGLPPMTTGADWSGPEANEPTTTLGHEVETPSAAPDNRAAKLAELRSRMKGCYQAAIKVDPSIEVGTPTIALQHDAGKITSAEIMCPALPPKLAACLTKIFVGRDDLIEGKGRTTIGPRCSSIDR